MISLVRLEPLQVIPVSVVDPNCKPIIEEGFAGAVVLVVALLSDVRMGVAVQDGDGHVVGDRHGYFKIVIEESC